MRGLADKVIVVAGGGSGIGAATCRRLAEEGARVVVGDLVQSAAEDVARTLNGEGLRAAPFQFDIVEEGGCQALIQFAVREYGGLDGVYNVAADLSEATLGRDTDVVEIDPAVWRRTLDVNLTGPFFVARHAIPALLARGSGSIVNTLSALVFYGDRSRPAYGSSKAGLIALTKHIAARWGKAGIRCNAVVPGLVLTEQVARNTTPAGREETLAATKLARLGRPEDIAATVAFLLSDDASWVTGQMHLVNGGREG